MKIFAAAAARSLSAIACSSMLLVACTIGSSSGGGVPSAVSAIPTTLKHATRHSSWMLPGASNKWLLYVSDAYGGAVDIYDYGSKKNKLYGQLTGFDHPLGLCVDAAGNVYVDDYDGYEVDEYAHGSTTPIATVSDSYGRPDGCAVDRSTGNIAVTNAFNPSGAGGNIVVFTGGLNGNQTEYGGKNIDLDSFSPPAYDANGNLFLEGDKYSTQPVFAELPAGSSTLVQLSGLTITQAAAVEWDGSYIDATDADYKGEGVGAINRVKVSASAVKVVRTTILTDDCYGSYDYASFYQPYIGGTGRRMNTVIAGNTAVECPNRVGIWNFAKGGNPKRVLPAGIAPALPAGATLSAPAARSSSHRNQQ